MIILVGGQKSGSGKTTFICALLKAFPNNFSVLKITPSVKRQDKIETAIAALSEKGKDTSLFLKYNAKKVVWVHGERKNIASLISEALLLLNGNIIIEGNSAMLSVNFDVAFFVSKHRGRTEKSSAKIFEQKADFIIMNTLQTTSAYTINNTVYVNLGLELRSPSKSFIKIFGNILHLT